MNDMQSLSYARWGCQHQVTKKGLTPYIHKVLALIVFGAGGRNRTDMSLRSRDFESRASTSFTTPAVCFGKERRLALWSRTFHLRGKKDRQYIGRVMACQGK